jgi:endonuclease YncB( thermonuclease family)
MQPRETLTNLAITLAVILAVAVLSVMLKAGRPTPVAIPVAVSPVVPQEQSIVASPAAAVNKTPRKVSDRFLTFPNPELVTSATGEADMFQFRIGGEVVPFSLYFVDALESTDLHPQRLGGQAKYFGKASLPDVMASGREAFAFVMNLLKTKPFFLLTRWEQQSSTDRYYALILVEDSKGKPTYLQDILVKQGYARVDGATTPLPDDHRTVESYLAELREDAAYARMRKLGIWAKVK